MAGIEEASIHAFVHGFYGKVCRDERLGPLFAARIDDWDAHLERMCGFWSTVLLGGRRFHGDPMSKHVALEGVQAADFDRWLELFGQTLHEVYRPETAAAVLFKAERIAAALQSRMFGPAVAFPLKNGASDGPRPAAPARAPYRRTAR